VVKKLQDFSTAVPVAADQIVGVVGGTSNRLFTCQQVTNTYRIKLTTTTNYYVATTGSDSAAGTIGAPWLTLQHAIDFIENNIDFGGQQLIVNVGAGSFVGFGMKSCVGAPGVPPPNPPRPPPPPPGAAPRPVLGR
jgi:hypothetical protein